MIEIKAITYEQARTDFLKAEMEKAQNRMKFWQTKIKKAKNAIAEMEAHDNASNAGWEYNFYKDALEALENNRFQYETGFVRGFESAQPKWISVEDELPPVGTRVLACAGGRVVYEACIDCNERWKRANSDHGFLFKITHWTHLPKPPKEE